MGEPTASEYLARELELMTTAGLLRKAAQILDEGAPAAALALVGLAAGRLGRRCLDFADVGRFTKSPTGGGGDHE